MSARGRTKEPTPHVCRGCTLPFVQPQRVVASGSRWRVYLRCPSCDWTAEELPVGVMLAARPAEEEQTAEDEA
jgi:hypothetical protein